MGSGTKDKTFARLTGSIIEDRQSRKGLFSTQSQFTIEPDNYLEQIHQVENEILKSQMRKEEYENEYSKIPESYAKSYAQKERKKFLLEQIEKLALFLFQIL